MNSGKKFEELIKLSANEQGIDYTRFKDAGFVGDKSESRRFTPKNICDCLLFAFGKLYYLEAKSRVQSLRFDEITQRDALVKKQMSLSCSNITTTGQAGVIIYFQKENRYFYINVVFLEQLESDCGKKSFNGKDVVSLSDKHPDFVFEIKTFIPKGKKKERIDFSILF